MSHAGPAAPVGPVVRPRADGDLPACVDALGESHEGDGYPMQWPADPGGWLDMDHPLGAWVARDGGRVVGHVVLVDAGPGRATVHRLFVRPSAQRRGVASALLAVAVARGEELGRRVGLDVIEDAVAAIRCYEARGWTRTGEGPAPFTRPDGTTPRQYLYAAPRGRPG